MKSGALFRYTPGVESETALARAAVAIKRPYLWAARPRWGQGAAARSGREGPPPHPHPHPHPHPKQAEWDMTERTGFKYAVGFNSCGVCLHLSTGAHPHPEPEHSTPFALLLAITTQPNPNPDPKP